MALPREIDTSVSNYVNRQACYPAAWNNSVYMPLHAGNDCEFWRSVNPVDDAFVHLDAAGEPSNFSLNNNMCVTDQYIHIVNTKSVVTDADSYYSRFNMETETWDVIDVLINNITQTIVISFVPGIVGGEDGDLHVLIPANRSKVMGQDYARAGHSISTDQGATWSTVQELNVVDEAFDIRVMGIIEGDAGIAHMFYCRYNVSSGSERMWQRTVNASGTLQTERVDVDGSNTYYFGNQPTKIMAGNFNQDRSGTSKCRALYRGDGNSGTDLLTIEFDSVADPSTFVTAVVQTSAIDVDRDNFDLSYKDATQFAVYGQDTGSQIDREDDAGTDTWTGSATQINTNDPRNLNCNVLIRDGVARLAVVYNNVGNNPEYDEVDLTDTAPTLLSQCEWPAEASFLGPFEI